MLSRPITSECATAFSAREHVCFGISPFNSYFSEARIEQLARWGKSEFHSMHFFVPDVPSVYTLEALGYTSERAAWKARRQAQYLYNKISKSLARIGYDSHSIPSMILNWNQLQENPYFVHKHQEIIERFEEDRDFESACIEASAWVLEGRLPPGAEASENQLFQAVRYLLAEIPLFLDTAAIVGSTSSVFVYHQCVPFIERLVSGGFGCKRNPSQGFVVIEPPTDLATIIQCNDESVFLSEGC